MVRKLRSAAEVPERVGELISQTAPDIYRFIYGDAAAEALTALAREPGNCFSWTNLWVAYECDAQATDQGAAVGVLVGYEPSQLEMGGYVASMARNFGLWRTLRCALCYNMLYALAGTGARLPCEERAAHSFLVQELAVDERVRGRGIATRLVNALERHAARVCEASGPGARYCLTLEVAEENHNAQRLYEHLGFERAERAPRYHTPFPCLPGAVRWWRMVKDCTEPPFPDPDCFDESDDANSGHEEGDKED